MEHPLKRTAKELNQAIQSIGDDVIHAVTMLGQLHGQIEQVDLNKLFTGTKHYETLKADYKLLAERYDSAKHHVTGLHRDIAVLREKNKEQMHTIMHGMMVIDELRNTEKRLLEDIDRLTGKRQADALKHERAMSELAEVHAARIDTMHDELASLKLSTLPTANEWRDMNARIKEANQIITDMQDELAAHILRNARLQAENDELRFHAQHADPHMPTPCVVPFPWHRDKK